MACKLNGTKFTTKTQEGRMMFVFQRCMTTQQKQVVMTPTLACAIVGNVLAESGCDPAAENKKSGASGLFQFLGKLKKKFIDYCTEKNRNWKTDMGVQMDFFFSEHTNYDWEYFNREYKGNTNLGLEELTKMFCVRWERPGKHEYKFDTRISFAKKMAGLLDKYGDGCTVVTEGTNGGDGYDPCDEHQMTADELYEMFDDNTPFYGEGVGKIFALVGDSWAVGLVKSGIITKEHFNVSHVKDSMDVTWFAEQIKSASGEGIFNIILTSGLNSVGKGIGKITEEYRQCIDNAYDIGAKAVFIVPIPYTKHSNQKLFNDKRIDQINNALRGVILAAKAKYFLEKFFVDMISIPDTIKRIRDAMPEGDFHPKTNSHYRLFGSAILNNISLRIDTDEYKRLLRINKQPRQPEPGWSLRKQNTGKDFISNNPIYKPKNLTMRMREVPFL